MLTLGPSPASPAAYIQPPPMPVSSQTSSQSSSKPTRQAHQNSHSAINGAQEPMRDGGLEINLSTARLQSGLVDSEAQARVRAGRVQEPLSSLTKEGGATIAQV